MAHDIKVERKLTFDTAGGIFQKVRNNSSGALAAGDVVIWDTASSGQSRSSVTTTTTANNELIAGVMVESVARYDTGTMQMTGYLITENLKVEGTTDIVVGDALATDDAAKIARKAGGETARFAIALEGYTTNDAAGTIKAILVSNH